MVFPKSAALWVAFLALLLALGLAVFVYVQGGVSHAIRSTGVSKPNSQWLTSQHSQFEDGQQHSRQILPAFSKAS